MEPLTDAVTVPVGMFPGVDTVTAMVESPVSITTDAGLGVAVIVGVALTTPTTVVVEPASVLASPE